MQGASWLDTLLRDVRYALRQFVRNPLFTIVAMISLAIGIGAALGIVLTIACTRVIAGRLYGLSTLDPLTILSAVVLFMMVAVIAAFIPAARAARANPIVALRHE
jgi:ABC-type antimicrobial peptide transport system permease subunit